MKVIHFKGAAFRHLDDGKVEMMPPYFYDRKAKNVVLVLMVVDIIFTCFCILPANDLVACVLFATRHNLSKKTVFSKWQICRDHPELNLCKWHNGGMVTVPVPATTTERTEDSAEAPPLSESIFVNEPDMMLSSKWSNAEILQETVQKELRTEPNRFEGRLHRESDSAEMKDVEDQKFDETIMSANEDVFSA
ncbi:Protein CBG10046 [Caenorhabditis briggsae]|uniref:Protein CBG10046 n=1 Tax=Caenorhabditis briggsae TaxID=6238 RepID=A8XA91_CAEBR|nr:Protein CBG10046 [Caenorhabditis briggsae]CAP29559.1 Protein CBG10046 [Caenorhabditis briggsae]